MMTLKPQSFQGLLYVEVVSLIFDRDEAASQVLKAKCTFGRYGVRVGPAKSAIR